MTGHPPIVLGGSPGRFCMSCGAKLVERAGEPGKWDCPRAEEKR